MLSVARSRFHLPAQLVFLIVNGVGVLVGVIYDHQTPDLYEGQKHGSIGWVSTWVASAWVILSLVRAYSGSNQKRRSSGQAVTHAAMAMFRRFQDSPSSDGHRWSADSGQGTERNSESLFDQSRSPSIGSENQQLGHESPRHDQDDDDDADEEDFEKRSFLRRSTVDRFLSRKIGRFSGFKRTLQVTSIAKVVLDKMMLLFGFLCITTGAVVYGGVFVSSTILLFSFA